MSNYVYATRIVRIGSRNRLGLPAFTPPDATPGWEIAVVAHTTTGLLVTWRYPNALNITPKTPDKF